MQSKIETMYRESGGLSVIEIVVATAIIISLVVMTANLWQLYFKISRTNGQTIQTSLLTEEMSEALNLMRDYGWASYISTLSSNTTYYIYWNGSRYATSTTPMPTNSSYYTGIVFSPINRDTNHDIVTSGGTMDSHSRTAVISVYASTTLSQPLMQTSLLLHDIYPQ